MGKMTEDFFEDEENVYSEESREHLVEDEEITPEEEGWMMGYEEAG